MIDITALQVEQWIGAFFWPFLRVLALLSTAPMFGATEVPMQVRLGLAILVAVALAPMLPAMPPVEFGSVMGWTLVLQQLLIGSIIGLSMALILSVVQFAGSVVSLQMGLGFSTLFDPVQGVQVTSLASFLNLLTTLLFLSLNGHLMLLAVLARSFMMLPVSANIGIDAQSWHALVLEGSALFTLGVALAAPAVAILMIANLGLGVLSKLAPQLNLFAIGFPLFLAFGFFAMYLLMPVLQGTVRHIVEIGIDLSTGLLRQAAHGA